VILFVATTNADKLREIRSLLSAVPVTLASLADLPPAPEPEESGATFEANALLKARYYDDHAAPLRAGGQTLLTVAEDSGLEVDGLNGEPGVRSARFVRPDATYPERFAEIEARLRQRPEAPRTGRFVCAVSVVRNGTEVFATRGTIEGEIAPLPRGDAGFGYDPIFYYPAYARTLGEVTEAEKLRVAHRGVAFRHLAEWLARYQGAETKNGER
jgi:XTP/dITP diphosphohydrolase